jgi:hypothetical protein
MTIIIGLPIAVDREGKVQFAAVRFRVVGFFGVAVMARGVMFDGSLYLNEFIRGVTG